MLPQRLLNEIFVLCIWVSLGHAFYAHADHHGSLAAPLRRGSGFHECDNFSIKPASLHSAERGEQQTAVCHGECTGSRSTQSQTEDWGEAALAKFEPFILYFRQPLKAELETAFEDEKQVLK